jgi:energy-coupling factor transporter ATP-binding protein EcfA2
MPGETRDLSVDIPSGEKISLQRVTVFLGANGSGKSRLLQGLRKTLIEQKERSVVFIEGGRAIGVPQGLQMDEKQLARFHNYGTASLQYKALQTGGLAYRIRDIFFLLQSFEDHERRVHSDRVHQWQTQGCVGRCPTRGEPPLSQVLRRFSEIHPDVQLEIKDGKSFWAKKNGVEYSVDALSDGEKQCLAILADLAVAEQSSVFVVDEPELNMHPILAAKLWTRIEKEFPSTHFVYATHCISFAMRETVDQVFTLRPPAPPIIVDDPSSLDPQELRPFLGSIPAILSANRGLIVEGDNSSFDLPFYKWIVGEGVEIIPLQGCAEVQAATNTASLWRRLAPGVTLLGVVDRDYRSDARLETLRTPTCLTLDLHEAESYLCHPTLLAKLVDKTKLLEHSLSEAQITEMLLAECRGRLRALIAQRVFSRASLSLNVSIPSKALAHLNSDADLLAALKQAGKVEAGKASEEFKDTNLTKLLIEEKRRCEGALTTGPIEEVLRLFPGKELLEWLAPQLLFKSADNLLVAAKNHFKPEDFPHLSDFQARLQGALSTGSKSSQALQTAQADVRTGSASS